MTSSTSLRTSREIRLAARPRGVPNASTFSSASRTIATPGDGDVVVANTYLSVDPYMRGRMDEGPSYIDPWPLGEPLDGAAVGVVVESRAPELPVGTTVAHQQSWREVASGPASEFEVLDVDGIDPSAYLGVLGVPGFTAWYGIDQIAAVRPGETVFVSGAAGAVGSFAGQLAHLRGASRVIGSAGSAEKVAWLTGELGFDAAFDYHDRPVTEALRTAAPDGIDVYFDNVGGDHLEAALAVANDHARFVLCGSIAGYNDIEPQPGPTNLDLMVERRIRAEGFIILDEFNRLADFRAEVTPWVRDGKLRSRETVVAGLDAMPEALVGLFRGTNVGKMVVAL